MITFMERAIHSVSRTFSKYIFFLNFIMVLGRGYVILLWHYLCLPYNYFGIVNRSVALIVPVPVHCLPFIYLVVNVLKRSNG